MVALNVGLNDKPEKIEAFVNELKARGITVAGRGAAHGSGESEARTDIGPWEKAWCALKEVSRVRRTNGRSFEQAAFHNFETQAPDSKPKGLRAPRA